MLLFALDATRAFGTRVADVLGLALAPHEERTFEDAEHKIRPLADPLGRDCVVVQSLHGEPACSGDDKLVRLLMFLAALRDHGARRVIAVVPYLAYARKDRRTQPFDPVSIRVVAQLFEAVGCDALLTIEAHNAAAFDNAFRMRAVSLSPNALYTEVVLAVAAGEALAVASPDIGGVKRAQLWREALEKAAGRPIGQAFVDKRRAAGVVSGGDVVTGDVAGATVLIVDDLIATFGTIDRAANSLIKAGAQRVLAFAAHGLFVRPAADVLAQTAVARVFVTDTVPLFRLEGHSARSRVDVLPCAALFAEAIRHELGIQPATR
ncbi:MAG: ribose-phosphate diphosphokinase [Burkholderiaceae bacterium]